MKETIIAMIAMFLLFALFFVTLAAVELICQWFDHNQTIGMVFVWVCFFGVSFAAYKVVQ